MEPTLAQMSDFLEQSRLGRATKENFQTYLDSVRKLVPAGLYHKLLAQARKLVATTSEESERFQHWKLIAEVSSEPSDMENLMLDAVGPFEICQAHLLSAKRLLAGALRDTLLDEAREAAREIQSGYERGVAYALIAQTANSDGDFAQSLKALKLEPTYRQEIAYVEVVRACVVNNRIVMARDLVHQIVDSDRQVEALALLVEKSKCDADRQELVVLADKEINSNRTRAEKFALVARAINSKKYFSEAIHRANSIFKPSMGVWDKDEVLILIIRAYLAWNNLSEARKIAEEVRSNHYRPQAFAIIAEASGDDSDFAFAQGSLKHSKNKMEGVIALARALKAHQK